MPMHNLQILEQEMLSKIKVVYLKLFTYCVNIVTV